MIVQAIGATKCLYPLAACSWRDEPQGEEVLVTELEYVMALE